MEWGVSTPARRFALTCGNAGWVDICFFSGGVWELQFSFFVLFVRAGATVTSHSLPALLPATRHTLRLSPVKVSSADVFSGAGGLSSWHTSFPLFSLFPSFPVGGLFPVTLPCGFLTSCGYPYLLWLPLSPRPRRRAAVSSLYPRPSSCSHHPASLAVRHTPSPYAVRH